jgi:hypothetical protein
VVAALLPSVSSPRRSRRSYAKPTGPVRLCHPPLKPAVHALLRCDISSTSIAFAYGRGGRSSVICHVVHGHPLGRRPAPVPLPGTVCLADRGLCTTSIAGWASGRRARVAGR